MTADLAIADTGHTIETLAQLEALFGTPGEASLSKEVAYVHPSYRAM